MIASHEIAGFVAAALVLGTFVMKDMRLLRGVAILSNVAFIVYACTHGLMPVLLLHAALIPINAYRLTELFWTERRGRADGDPRAGTGT